MNICNKRTTVFLVISARKQGKCQATHTRSVEKLNYKKLFFILKYLHSLHNSLLNPKSVLFSFPFI